MTQFDPGLLRRRVQVERPIGESDDAGGETITWEPVATLWARIDPVRADEKAVAAHLAAVVTHRITFRWHDDLIGGMRITLNGRHFRVRAVFDPDERRRYIVALSEEEKS